MAHARYEGQGAGLPAIAAQIGAEFGFTVGQVAEATS